MKDGQDIHSKPANQDHNWSITSRKKISTAYGDLSRDILFWASQNSDQISDALDYDAICSHTVELVKKTSFRLIERLAEEVAQSIIKKFGAEKVNVLLIKPNALKHTSEVGIQISRGKHDSK